MLSIATSGANASGRMPWYRRHDLERTVRSNGTVRFFGPEVGLRMTPTHLKFIGSRAVSGPKQMHPVARSRPRPASAGVLWSAMVVMCLRSLEHELHLDRLEGKLDTAVRGAVE
jgi:hypothetical protein